MLSFIIGLPYIIIPLFCVLFFLKLWVRGFKGQRKSSISSTQLPKYQRRNARTNIRIDLAQYLTHIPILDDILYKLTVTPRHRTMEKKSAEQDFENKEFSKWSKKIVSPERYPDKCAAAHKRLLSNFTSDEFIKVADDIWHQNINTVGIARSCPDSINSEMLKRHIEFMSDPDRFEQLADTVIRLLEIYSNRVDRNGLFETYKLADEETVHRVKGFVSDWAFQIPRTHDNLAKGGIPLKIDDTGQLMNEHEFADNSQYEIQFRGTPFIRLKQVSGFIGSNDRTEHTHILGASGSGKSHLIKHMIARDLAEDCCVIVIDSQTSLISDLLTLDIENESVTWISPENDLALNLFDVGYDEIAKNEKLVNNTISLWEYVLQGLMDAELTPRQRNLFQYSIQLLITLPNANIHTFFELLEDPFQFSPYIDKLDETVQRFFNKDFMSSNYQGTRTELRYRLDTLLRNSTFRRIFSAVENRVDIFDEMEEAKLILLDTNQPLLDDSARILGRLFIAMILQASHRRIAADTITRPVYLYIDEAHEYFDDKLEQMLHQARKAGIGVILAHQDLSQTQKVGITGAIMVNTATKFVSTRFRGDASYMAASMRTSPEFILELEKYHFSLFHPSHGSVDITAPEYPFKDFSRRTNLQELRKEMEEHYGSSGGEMPNPIDNESTETKPPSTSQKSKNTTMGENDDQDIKPGDTL